MTVDHDQPDQPERSDVVAKLIQSAGRRVDPPSDAYRRVFDAAATTWRRKVARRRRWRHGIGLAATFVLLSAGLALVLSLQPDQATRQVGRVERMAGDVQARSAGAGAWIRLVAGGLPLHAGTHLRTGTDGRVDLRLDSGVSLRVAARTDIELQSLDAVSLLAGTVYTDTGAVGSHSMVITTPAGTARDVGTQFELRYASQELRLSVREGRVALQRRSGDLVAATGERLSIDRTGEVTRANVAFDDPDWAWTETLATMPDFNDQPVAALLDWVAHDTGRTVRYADAVAETRASTVILHGRTGPLEPLDALRVLLSTTDFTYRILQDGTIEIRYR